MRSKEEIMKDVMSSRDIPDGYSLLEQHCFLVVTELLGMYNRGEVSKEYAGKQKTRIFKEYEEECKTIGFMTEMWKENVDNIKETENDRIRLHKLLADKTDSITDEDMAEILRTCLGIIGTVFPGEFNEV